MNLIPAELIKKKREGEAFSDEEIKFFIEGYTHDRIPDYQMSAFLMATFFRGMDHRETLTLTKCMLESGSVVDTSSIKGFKVDKHSTGGVGDKTSLILGPVVAAAGIAVPMISGRGLGHTGGTLDKLESIPGFQINKPLDFFVKQVRETKICFIGQTPEICPADRKIYALRDVTATVESLPLICASILSKKLAEGIDGLVLDVKVGNGAFMKDVAQAEKLAILLRDVARGYGKKVSALLTEMSQPMGRFAGNAHEVLECLEIMKGKRDPLYEDTRALSLRLSGEMLWLAGAASSPEAADELAEKTLESGKALEKFEEMCRLQGGDLSKIKYASKTRIVRAGESGFIATMDTESIGYSGILMGAGRRVSTDKINHDAGIEFHVKLGSEVKSGDPLFTVHCDDEPAAKTAADRLATSVTYSLQKTPPASLIKKTIR